MKGFFRKKNIKSIVSLILVIVLVVTTLGITASFLSKDTKNISPSAFAKGDLDTSGKYKRSETSIYTEDMFECQGLAVTVDFEADLKYIVYYYRANGSYLGTSGFLTSDYQKNEEYINAKYARIVIYPTLENEKIRFWEVRGIAKQLTITVNKDQSFEPVTVPVFSDVTTVLSSDNDFYTSYAAIRNDAPFVLAEDNLTAFAGKHITKIGVPVKLIKDVSEDTVFKVRLVSGNGSTAFKTVKTYELVIEANTFGNLEKVTKEEATIPSGTYEMEEGKYHEHYEGWYKVDQWVYFDVDIDVKSGQTLAFGDATDTVVSAYRHNDTSYRFYSLATKTASTPHENLSIYFDVWYEE